MGFLLHNWMLKLMALGLAIALWSHVRGEVNPLETATFSLPLEGGEHGVERVDLVRVSLRAPRVRLREFKGGVPNPLAPPDEAPILSQGYARAFLDPAHLQSALNAPSGSSGPGVRMVPVRVECELPDVEILAVRPEEVAVRAPTP